MNKPAEVVPFSSYQKFVVFILAMTQFSVILDFMIMSPLGDMLMKSLSLTPAQFGVAVSAYAFSAGISGLLTAGFADHFDRKKLLVFFYTGFVLGTLFCSIATSYPLLVAARIITGLFGGVIGSVSMAIITDLFSLQQRGRTMGFIQMGFGASQVLGIPISLFLANRWTWQSPFLMVAILAALILLVIIAKLQPITKHLSIERDKTPVMHLWHTLTNSHYSVGFIGTALLSIGGFMMMPFGSAFAINNLKITQEQLPFLFMISGVCSLIIMPIIGRVSDKVDKFTVFAVAGVWTMVMVAVYTNLFAVPFWLIIICNVLLMMGIMSRIVPATALVSAIPNMADRGAFMSINSSLQQIAGGIAAVFAGTIVVQKDKMSPLEHYNTLGYIMIGISVVSIYAIYRVSMVVKKRGAQ
jgi:predicted MFS family arabinose efflux permease